MIDFSTQSNQRSKYEANILDIFTHSIQIFDSKLKVSAIGSVVYGFHGSNTNYNILIDTRKFINISITMRILSHFVVFVYEMPFF